MIRHRTFALTGSLILGLGLVTPSLADEDVIDQRRANEEKRIADGLRDGSLAPTPYVDRRLDNEQRRIDAGVADGSLTEREARRLQRAEDRIRAEEERFKSDGNFTPRERQKVVRDEKRLSRQIYRQRHDAQRRR
jgi:hypothetical protein